MQKHVPGLTASSPARPEDRYYVSLEQMGLSPFCHCQTLKKARAAYRQAKRLGLHAMIRREDNDKVVMP